MCQGKLQSVALVVAEQLVHELLDCNHLLLSVAFLELNKSKSASREIYVKLIARGAFRVGQDIQYLAEALLDALFPRLLGVPGSVPFLAHALQPQFDVPLVPLVGSRESLVAPDGRKCARA